EAASARWSAHLCVRRRMEGNCHATDAGVPTRHNPGRFEGKSSLGAEAGCRDFVSAKSIDPCSEYENEALRMLPHGREPDVGRASTRRGSGAAAVRASLRIY